MAQLSLSVQQGQRFGRGVVLDPEVKIPIPSNLRGVRSATLACDCGNVYTATLHKVLRGLTISCGCYRAEQSRRPRLDIRGRVAPNRTHGLTTHPLYKSWRHMLARCEDPRNPKYPDYGARGIRVCDRWHDVRLFVTDIERWLGPRPPGMSLDRICNDHDYRLDNVRWATATEQALNRRPRRKAA